MYSSYLPQTENIIRSSVGIPFINMCTSLLCAIVLFSFLGHMSHVKGISIDDIPIEGVELAFVAYPALLT